MGFAIITDGTVQFPNPVFEGRNHVTILPNLWENGKGNSDQADQKLNEFPQSILETEVPQFKGNSADIYQEQFERLAPRVDGILVICNSSFINANAENAEVAAEEMQGKVPIRVIDSQNFSLAMGILVQEAAKNVEALDSISELELLVRNLIPRIYSVLCIPGLSYLEHKGQVNHTQALVGEYLEMLPVFTLDKGELVHSEKARNNRHLVDILHEFLTEFGDLEHISLLQGLPSFETETRALRERLLEDHADTLVSEQTIGTQIASIIGPHSLGIFALQSEE
jgi:DegV family protein with EDD domain